MRGVNEYLNKGGADVARGDVAGADSVHHSRTSHQSLKTGEMRINLECSKSYGVLGTGGLAPFG